MEYTMNMVDATYDMAQLDDYDVGDYSQLLEFLNSPNFRTFGEGLEGIIRSKMPKDCALTPKKFLESKCKESGIVVASASTLRNWFTGSPRSRKDEKSRENMFASAFALELTVEETQKLFHDVYLDRAYNKRNHREVIYYHCLKNRHSYAYAQKLISMVTFSSGTQDATMYTAVISQQTDNLRNDTQLLDYINSHPHNFHLDNISAHAVYEQQWEKARLTVDKEMGFAQRESTATDRIRGNWDSKRLGDLAEKDINSAAFDFEMITGQSISIRGATGTKPLSFKNALLPKEIKTNFPASPNLGENPSSEQLRKMIILLFSYTFWYNVQTQQAEDSFDDYVDQLDDLLNGIGYPPMYHGNPYDWLFLVCSNMARPLDAFRDILDEVLHGQE